MAMFKLTHTETRRPLAVTVAHILSRFTDAARVSASQGHTRSYQYEALKKGHSSLYPYMQLWVRVSADAGTGRPLDTYGLPVSSQTITRPCWIACLGDPSAGGLSLNHAGYKNTTAHARTQTIKRYSDEIGLLEHSAKQVIHPTA
ncbi:hypothetical protein BJ138DRAFT_1107443 [Hygrophoropsis aurantiaca]|uniref:Uncharacterized protein n=1 Tax=Hygrophoropsis aurantiaca TaxID=72124 RepID=A0ACB7ZR83_9AGAM|nr:hypothetical protein BJ138DRAFT_1107443 [Hygrophoropsis aurantiaca]